MKNTFPYYWLYTLFYFSSIALLAQPSNDHPTDSLLLVSSRTHHHQNLARYFKQEALHRNISLDFLSIWPNELKPIHTYSAFLIGDFSELQIIENVPDLQQKTLKAFIAALTRWSQQHQVEFKQLDLSINVTINDKRAPLLHNLKQAVGHLPIHFIFQYYPSNKPYLYISMKGF